MRILNTCVKAYIWTVTALILTFSHSAPVLGPADDSIGATLIPKYGTGSLTPSDSLDEVDNILRDGIRAWGLEADGGPKAPPIIEPIEKRPPSKPKVSSTPKKPGAGDKPRKGKSRNHGSKPNAQDPKHDPLDDDFDDDDDLWDGPIDEDEFVKTSFWIKDSFEIRCADPKHIFKSPIAVERTKGLLPEDFSWRNFDDTPWMAEQFIREMQESCIENCGCDDWASLHAPEARKNDGLSYCQTIKDARKCEWVFGCQCWAELGDPEIPEKFENMTVQNWASELSSLPMNLRKAHPNWRWNNGPKGWNNQSLDRGTYTVRGLWQKYNRAITYTGLMFPTYMAIQ
ncbi:uncharacterized protein DFL_008772 [Arthrobotrys flagrans]|uniref:Uncharacterized protein n=1 Tax=Arthrobotrys flagrans TaxID=97331 RepID=A0A436ZPV2_ARTFL|nr:hypothetical protein DFL_008772 [Arthrobotrys flagrans]